MTEELLTDERELVPDDDDLEYEFEPEDEDDEDSEDVDEDDFIEGLDRPEDRN